MNNKVSFVLGTYNRLSFLKLTIESIRREILISNILAEIIVVDGGSDDGSIEWLCGQKDILTIIQHNRGVWEGKKIEKRSWGYFMNLAFKVAQGKFICMVSDDCWLVPNSISNAIKEFDKELKKGTEIGGVAFYWRNWPVQKEFNVGLTIGEKMFINHGLFLREAMEKVHFVNENDYSFYHADGDLSLKIWKAGYKIIDSKKSLVEHYAHANSKVRKSNNTKQQEDWDMYLKTWKDGESDFEGGWKILEEKVESYKIPFVYKINRFIDLITLKTY